VVFEGIVGVGAQGDIALDEIILVRKGNAPAPVSHTAFGLPNSCNFDVSN